MQDKRSVLSVFSVERQYTCFSLFALTLYPFKYLVLTGIYSAHELLRQIYSGFGSDD